jgi:hypothetical protein
MFIYYYIFNLIRYGSDIDILLENKYFIFLDFFLIFFFFFDFFLHYLFFLYKKCMMKGQNLKKKIRKGFLRKKFVKENLKKL